METIEITPEILSNYQKNKESIYKWRNNNRDKFLLKQHEYFKNKMQDEEKRKIHLERVKERNRQLKKDEEEKTGIIKKVGRPCKYS